MIRQVRHGKAKILTSYSVFGGSGLGLFVSRKLCELMGKSGMQDSERKSDHKEYKADGSRSTVNTVGIKRFDCLIEVSYYVLGQGATFRFFIQGTVSKQTPAELAHAHLHAADPMRSIVTRTLRCEEVQFAPDAAN